MPKLLHKIFFWKKPSALHSRFFLKAFKEDEKIPYTWEDWEVDMKSQFPIRYFICESLPDFYSHIKYKVGKFFYCIKSITYKKQHILDLRQPKNSQFGYRYGYSDVRQKFIYANFNLLCHFVEKEYDGVFRIQSRIDWLQKDDNNIKEIEFLNKVIELYWWWKHDVQKKYEQLYNNTDNNTNYVEFGTQSDALEAEIDCKLQELLSFRQYFWT